MSFEDHEAEFLGVDDEERARRQKVLNQRSGDALRQKWAQEDREALQEAERLMAPPAITASQCHVCQSDFRLYIERQLVKGRSYASIARTIPDGSVSRKSIRNHFQEHMAIDQAAVRAILEDEAKLINQNFEEGVQGAFTLRGALDVLVRKGYEDALNGVTTVEVKDLIQMIKLYKDMDTDSSSTAVEEAKTAIAIFMAAIQNILLKSDLIERAFGQVLLEAIATEVEVLRSEEAVEVQIERQLMPPPSIEADAIPDLDE